jgi:hypothetical protein
VVNASVITVTCTGWHCGFHYLNQFCFYVANWFVSAVVDLCADPDVFAWYICSPWNFQLCRYCSALAAAQVCILLWPACVHLLKHGHMYSLVSSCDTLVKLCFITTRTAMSIYAVQCPAIHGTLYIGN